MNIIRILAAISFIFATYHQTANAVLMGSASVNGETVITPARGLQKGDATGISVAGARVANPLPNGKEEFRVSSGVRGADSPPNAVELPILQRAIEAAGAVGVARGKDAAKDRFQRRINSIIPIPGQAGPPPVAAGFTEIMKPLGPILAADAGPVVNVGIREQAAAQASQFAQGSIGTREFRFGYDIATTINDINLADNLTPGAIAFGVNRDPFAIIWEEPAAIEINLSDIRLMASASDGASAGALYGIDILFTNFDNPDNIPSDQSVLASLEDTAMELFSLSIFVSDEDEETSPLFEVTLLNEASILDTLLNATLEDILSGLAASTSLMEGVLSFKTDYSIEVTLPTDPLTNDFPVSSVLWVRDSAAAAATAVPEPSTFILLGIGLTSLGFARFVNRSPCKIITRYIRFSRKWTSPFFGALA